MGSDTAFGGDIQNSPGKANSDIKISLGRDVSLARTGCGTV